jgi:hypothetical protein
MFIITLYGRSGFYKTAPLSATATWNLIATLEDCGALFSTEKAP